MLIIGYKNDKLQADILGMRGSELVLSKAVHDIMHVKCGDNARMA